MTHDRKEAVIVGWAHSPFGKLEAEDIEALIASVGTKALEHAGVSPQDIGFVTVGVLNAGFSKQGFEAGLVSVADRECLRNGLGRALHCNRCCGKRTRPYRTSRRCGKDDGNAE